jgi:hypothetical protein
LFFVKSSQSELISKTKKQMGKPQKTTRRTVRQPKQSGQSSAPVAENRAALRIMRGLKGPNDKYIQTTLATGIAAGAPTLTAPTIQCLNVVAQGTSENTRIGRLCKMKWIDINVELTSTANGGTQVVRWYLIVETSALGSNLAPSQFLLDNANFSPLSQRDRTNRDASRYCVIYDSKPCVIGGFPFASGLTAPVSVGSGQPAERVWSLHLPLNFSTDYSRANGGTVADIDTNALSILILSDDGNSHVVATATWTIAFNDDS